MPGGIKFRWTPLAVDTLIDLEDQGLAHVAQRIVQEAKDRLAKHPGIYREVTVQGYGRQRRRRTKARRLFLGKRLPYLVYFHYSPSERVVEIVRILHARQKPIER